MEEFYPSEIARLVLGYLKDAKCLKSWETFLEECSDLDEHSRLYKEGKFCSTNVNGKSLTDVLKEYCVLKREAVIENNQNKYAKNTYEFEVLKTPNKANENAFTTIRINQKFQSQSVVSSSLGQIHSPSSSSIFRTPPSRPSGQTPRRRIECQATPLNFGPEAESACRTYSDLCINKNANTLLRTPLRKKNSLNPRNNTCISDSVLSVKSKFQERIVQNYANPNFRSHLNVDTTRNQNELLLPPSAYQPKSSEKSNTGHTNASGSQNKNANNSNTIGHSAQKEKIHNTFDYSDLIQFNNPVSASEKQNSQTVEQLEEGQSTVLNKSYTYQSSEITKSQNIPSLENCFTPQYTNDPPPYNRAPFTNSPRIILSHDRSQIPSLTTPVKDTRWMEDEWSPKRKGSIPRRRLITESPLSKYLQQPENLSFESMLEYMYGNEEELTHNPVVQLLTDNINKVKQNEMLKDQDGKKAIEQDVNLENIVKSATELIEEDPILGRYFAVGLREEVNLNAELSAPKSCEVNSGDSEIESFPSASVTSASDKHSNDNQNKNVSHSVRGTEESDLLVNVLRETFGEITNPPHISSSNPCIGRVNENNANNHESFADDHETNVSTNDLSVNIQNGNNEAEGKNDVPDNSCTSTKQPTDLLTSNTVEKSLDRDYANDKSDLSDGSKTAVDSVQLANTSEDLNNVKNNLEVSSNENVSRTDLNNGLLPSTSNCEINQTSQSNASVINTQVTSSAANLESSNIPCATTFITPQLPSQPMVEFPLSLPYFGLLQNGVYRIILNSPITWNTTPAGGLCTTAIPTGDISSPLILNPAPVSTVPNVENVEMVNTGVAPCNSGNFVSPSTITSGHQLSQFNNTLSESVPACPQIKTPPKRICVTCKNGIGRRFNSNTVQRNRGQKNTKRKKTEKGDSPQTKRSNKGGSTSSAKRSKKPQKKRPPKRKPLCLFPPSQQVEKNTATPEKGNDNVPVLSIPDTPSLSGQSSAYKLMSQITGQFEKEDRSPVLKMLMTNAAMLSQSSSRLNSSHVRCLDFGSNLNGNTEDNGLQTNSKDGKPKEKISEKSPVQSRRSLRIQQSKEKQNQSQGQGKNGLKSKSPSPKVIINKRKRSLPKKRPLSTYENSTIDMTAAILYSMEEARQNAINATQTSENVPNIAFCTIPSNQDFQKEVNVNLVEDVQMIDLEDDVSTNNEKAKLNTCFTISQSVSDPIVNDSCLHTEQMQRQGDEISTKERIENIEEFENSVHNVENVIQEEPAEPIVTKSSDFENSTELKPAEKLTVSEPSFIESSHSQTETKKSDCYEPGKINTSSNEKEDAEIQKAKDFTTEKVLKRADLSNYLFGSDSSSDESNIDDSSNIVHEESTSGNFSVNTNAAEKNNSISNHLEAEKGCLEKDENRHLAVPDCSFKSISKAVISTIISPIKEKYPVINKKISATSNSKPFTNAETCDQLDGKSKLGCKNKKKTKELLEGSVRKSRNSPRIIDIKRQIIEGNSLRAKQRASTVSINIENSIAMNSDGEISDSYMPNESFYSYSNKDRENCRMEINTADSDNRGYVESVNLSNHVRHPSVHPVNTSENNKNISNECDNDIQLSMLRTTSSMKEKNISKISLSSTPKQALLSQKRERTSFKKSKNLVLQEGNINELSKTGTSLEQYHELLDVTRSDNLEEKSKAVAREEKKKNISPSDKRRASFSPDFIIYGKHVVNDPVMATNKKVTCLSPSAPCNVNKKDKRNTVSDISTITNSNAYNIGISKPLVPSNDNNDDNLVDAIEENSSPLSNYLERVKSISDKDASHQTFKKSTKNEHRELKLRSSSQENNQSKIGRSHKASDLLTKAVDIGNKISCDFKQNLELLSHEERKNLSNKHSNSRSLNSAVLFNVDKQTRSPGVENHKLSSTSSSTGHNNKNVYSNSKDSMHEHYSRKSKDGRDYKISHRERSFKNKSPKNVYQPEMLKNNDRYGKEFNPVDTNKRNSSIISHSSSYSDSSIKTSPQIIGSVPHTENPKNQHKMIDKINQSSTASHLLAGKDVPSIEENKNKIHANNKRSSQHSKRDGSQKSVDSKYPDKTYHSRREERERPQSSSLDKNNLFSSVKPITPSYAPKRVLSSSDRVKSSHSNVSKSNKSYLHGRSQRNSDNYFEVLETPDHSRSRNYSESVNSSKGNSKHTFTSRSERGLDIRKDSYKNMSDSVEHIRASSFAKTKIKETSALPLSAYKMDVYSESSAHRHFSTKEKRDHHSYSDSRKSVNFPKAQKHDLNPEKSTNLKAKGTMSIRDSSFQADNEELDKDTKKISDQETVSIHKENITPPNQLVVSQDYFALVDEHAQTSKVSVKSNNQSCTDSISAVHNAPIITSVKSSTVSESTVLPQSDDSLTSTSSKDAYHGTVKIHPPFKKRIRPIPVGTKSKLGTSAFPFCTDQKTVVTNSVMSSGNPTKIASVENLVVISPEKIQEKVPEQVDTVRTVLNPVAEMRSSSAVTTASNSISPEKEHLPNSRHIASTLVTPTKEIGSTFVTPVKEIRNSLPTFISPSSKSQPSYSTTPSPKIKSIFRSPYPQSGKPKSMEYFYRKAFPDKQSDLPISPLSFSNSSCTVDAFSAKRQLLGDDSSSQLINMLNVKNKTKAIISENNENSAGHVCAEEYNNQDFDGNETGDNFIVQEPSNKFNEKLFNDNGEQETGVYENDAVKEKEGVLLSRKRKRSESLYSDTCSTVVDCSDLEIMTPEKNDWLNKPLFSKDQSPLLSRKKKLRKLSSSSDVTPSSSPVKEKNLVSEPVCNSQLFSEKSLDKSSADIACNSSAKQDIHTENVVEDCSIPKSIIDSEKVQQSVKNNSKTKTTSHKSPLHEKAGPSRVTEENERLSELVTQDPKINLLLSKIKILGLDNILDRLEDK